MARPVRRQINPRNVNRGRAPSTRTRPVGGRPGMNRPAQVRGNNRRTGTFQPGPQQGFQGGVQLNRQTAEPTPLPGVQTSGDVPVMDPTNNRKGACPPGMTVGKDANTGASTCVPTSARGGNAQGGFGPNRRRPAPGPGTDSTNY
jgi:hypothetical protein